MAEEYRQRYGREPSQRTLWAMAQEVTLATRKAKRKTHGADAGQGGPRSAGEELDAWEARTTEREVSALSAGARSSGRVRSAGGPGRLRRSWTPAPGRASSGWRWPRRRSARRPGPGRRCCGSCTGPCPPWPPGVDQAALAEELADQALASGEVLALGPGAGRGRRVRSGGAGQ